MHASTQTHGTKTDKSDWGCMHCNTPQIIKPTAGSLSLLQMAYKRNPNIVSANLTTKLCSLCGSHAKLSTSAAIDHLLLGFSMFLQSICMLKNVQRQSVNTIALFTNHINHNTIVKWSPVKVRKNNSTKKFKKKNDDIMHFETKSSIAAILQH